jgi:hypothetical protein
MNIGGEAGVNPGITSPGPGQLYGFSSRGRNLDLSEIRYQER